MPIVTILYSFLGIVEVVVGEWVMEDLPRSVELVARGNTSRRAVAGGLSFAAFLCGLKSTLRRGVELVARGDNSRRAIAGGLFFAAFLCGLKSTLRRGVELVSRGQQRGSRHCRRGVLRGFLVWIKMHTTAWCGTCSTRTTTRVAPLPERCSSRLSCVD